MSPPLIARSKDLLQLRNEGYSISIRASHLIVSDIPYVNIAKEVKEGTLIFKLSLAGDRTVQPQDHVAMFCGEFPCNEEGTPLEPLRHGEPKKVIDGDLVANFSFSRKITEAGKLRQYHDHHEQVVSYVQQVSTPALHIDSTATPRPFKPIPSESNDGPFVYEDTASQRAGISALNSKLALDRIAIIGVGGTGGYILDFLVKTPAKELHIYDKDTFDQHTAFRAPGAATLDELAKRPLKVDYHAGRYSAIHRNIVPHPVFVDETNVSELEGMDFVFLCIDNGAAKKPIIEHLVGRRIPFIDSGMGLEEVDGSLRGSVRVTTSTSSTPYDFARGRISLAPSGVADEYGENIQVVELNALNAALAVMRFKKELGFYHDSERERFCTYVIDSNGTASGDHEGT